MIAEAPVTTTVANIDVQSDGTVTLRPSSAPPPPPAVMVDRAPAPEHVPGTELAMLLQIRKLWNEWKGGPYVCGNAFGYMNRINDLLEDNGL